MKKDVENLNINKKYFSHLGEKISFSSLFLPSYFRNSHSGLGYIWIRTVLTTKRLYWLAVSTAPPFLMPARFNFDVAARLFTVYLVYYRPILQYTWSTIGLFYLPYHLSLKLTIVMFSVKSTFLVIGNVWTQWKNL